ncbi:MAG: 4Fe-4S binding protein [Deltaproteobacteria bacterium]|nr:4Fe-4S binding protein [Deltaproteobacteria bacterium]
MKPIVRAWTEVRMRTPILLLGACTAVLQTLAVREAMASTGGNEAVVAALFGIWMVLTAGGAAIGRSSRATPRAVAIALVVYASCVPATLLAARASAKLLLPGAIPSVGKSSLIAGLLLAPSCLLAGWLYARLASGTHATSESAGVQSARAYLLDTLGSGLAGAWLALWVLDRALPFQVAGLAVAGALLGAAALLRRPGSIALGLAALASFIVLWRAPLDTMTYRWQTPGQSVIEARSSSRGALLVAHSHGQTQVLLEREPLLTLPDEHNAEWMTHVPLSLHPQPREVLVVGVAPAGSPALMQLHGVQHVDETVGDERIAQVISKLDAEAQGIRVRVLGDDERAWVRSTTERYDAVLVQSMPPTSVSGARLFSVEFYRELHRCLRPGGIVIVKAPAHASYAGIEQRRMHSGIASTLRATFAHVVVLPGPNTLYAASDAPLPAPEAVGSVIGQRLAQRAIRPGFVTSALLSDVMAKQRMADAERWASLTMPASTDAHPIVHRLALDAALAHLGDGGSWTLRVLALTIAMLALVWFSPRTRPVSFSVASTGFAGLALQLVLMLIYQTAVAALYRDVALVTAAFMAASCAGTWWGSRLGATRRALVVSDVAQAAIAGMMAAGAAAVIACNGTCARIAVVAGACAVGAASGVQIALASRSPEMSSRGPGGTVYAIDLMGAAFAALITYTLVVPSLGIAGTALCVAGVKALSAGALLAPARKLREAPSKVPGPAIALVVAVSLGVIDSTEHVFYALTVSRGYALAVLVVLLAMLGLAFQPRWLRERLVGLERRWAVITRTVALSPSRLVELSVLLPLGALPLARCYFKIPYLFCHTCPRPCAFGIMRPYLIPAALIVNLDDRRFCEKACPLGLAQRACERTRTRSLPSLGKAALVARLVTLGAVAVLYPMIASDRQSGIEGSGTFSWLFLNTYGISAWVLAASGALLIASFFVRRPFCDGACPIGATSDLVGRLEKRWLTKREQLEDEAEAERKSASCSRRV